MTLQYWGENDEPEEIVIARSSCHLVNLNKVASMFEGLDDPISVELAHMAEFANDVLDSHLAQRFLVVGGVSELRAAVLTLKVAVIGTRVGAEMEAGKGPPVVAVSSGVARASADGIGVYGNAVIIDGKRIGILHAHMVYGSRLPKDGEHVKAGQLIGHVGTPADPSVTTWISRFA